MQAKCIARLASLLSRLNKFMMLNVNEFCSITMLTLTMMNDNDIASKFNAIIHILFLFGRIPKKTYLVQPYFLSLSLLCSFLLTTSIFKGPC